MDVILQVFVIFAAGAAAGTVARRLRLPAIAGELAVGVAIGPHALGWIHLNDVAETLASLGVIVLLFTAGLEMRASDLAKVGVSAFVSSTAGVLVSAGASIGLVLAFGYRPGAALLAAGALAAPRAGIGSRVFTDLGLLRRRAGRVMMGAAVIDDVLILIALSIVLTSGTSQSAVGLTVSILSAVGFIALVVAVGPGLARRHGPRLAGARDPKTLLAGALVLCLGLAALAERAGLAALVGAFLAGMVLAETREHFPLAREMRPLAEFLVPFFFVVAGARVDLGSLSGAGIPLAIALSVVAVLTKVIGCAVGAVGLRPRERALVGAGMIPRGEVTLAAATAAFTAGRVPEALFSAVLAAVFVTDFAGPLAVRVIGGDHGRMGGSNEGDAT
ncbi:MAG: cation:proton antiporter [Actinomycetota bacterium]